MHASRLLLCLGVSLLTTFLPAQPPTTDDPLATYLETITPQNLKAHIYFLADDLLEGRETGHRGQHLAGLYIRSQFMRMGLVPGNPNTQDYFQPFYLNRASIEGGTMSFGGTTYKYREDFINAGTGLIPSGKPELVFVGYGVSEEGYDNLAGVDLKGNIALMMAGSPASIEKESRLIAQIEGWKDRADALTEKGADGVLILTPDSVYRILKRYARSFAVSIDDSPTPAVPVVYLSESMGNELLRTAKRDLPSLQSALAENDKLPKVKVSRVNLSVESNTEFSSQTASNVLGWLEGSEYPDELLVITGHYDHVGVNDAGTVFNGADDDASGTSTVLAVAEAFMRAARDGYRPKRSILFMTVSGEEKGLLGSEFYTDHPLYPLEHTVCNLNIDMVGRIDPRYDQREDSLNYVYLIGSDRLSTELHEASEAMNDQYTRLTLDYKYNEKNDPNRFYYRSDHYNFAKNNIPVIFYFNGTHEDYHQPGDDPVKIRFEKAARIAQLVFATAWEIANRDERIEVDVVER